MVNHKICFLFISLFFSLNIPAHELIRLDQFGSEDIKKSNYLIYLYSTENCSVCAQQVEILKQGLNKDHVANFLEGQEEEKLRFYLKKKKIPFKTFHLDQTMKSFLKFGKESPSVSYKSQGMIKNVIGLQSCDKIISLLKSQN